MNKYITIMLLVTAVFLSQCRAIRDVVEPAPPRLSGLPGMREVCIAGDTVHSLVISKADALIITEDERYEATLTLYAVKDSLIYISAVNSGFEILRATVEPDTIRVIDRLNKVVYHTPVKKRFGYQQPVNFEDIQNIINGFFVCDDLDRAMETNFDHIEFDFDDAHVKKRIFFNRETLKMDKFEFYHAQTGKYLRGDKDDAGFKIFTNFMITEFEIVASGGSITYNRSLPVKMDVNKRKYTYINI